MSSVVPINVPRDAQKAGSSSLGVSPKSAHSADMANADRLSAHYSTSSQSPNRPPAARHSGPTSRSRSKTRDPRRLSRVSAGTSSSPSERLSGKELEKKRPPTFGVIGVCALDTKARSTPSRHILNRLISNGDFEVVIFGDKIILDEEVENWPVCDYLISFFSEGFPLDKAIAYERLRRPFCVNDLLMQIVLWDRRLCLMILDSFSVPTPARIEVDRDGGPRLASPDLAHHLQERTGLKLHGPKDGTGGGAPPPRKVEMADDGDVLVVDGKRLRKPFVEKPVSGEDHNIHIYYPKSLGGGGRRLFRKVNNKSSELDSSLRVPRAITEPSNSYIYEQFIQSDTAEDVKVYTVGPTYCHAETRKSPVVDGIVKRNRNGKEVRYVTSLTKEEQEMAARVVQAFGQTVCGFDLLREGNKSYVIDVNGWSFVKDNNDYYENCARILKDMFVRDKMRREGRLEVPSNNHHDQNRNLMSHRSALKSILHSPSMSKLTHPLRHGYPETLSMSSPPTIENTHGTPVPSHPITLPPAAVDAPVQSANSSQKSPLPPPASKAQWKLKGMVSVIRHADRTPKQKFKFTFHTKPFVDLLQGHQEEVLVVGEAALNDVLEAVEVAIAEDKEDMAKLQLLKSSLLKKGSWAGTKVQIKPMFRPRDSKTVDDSARGELHQHDSTQSATLSRIAAVENNLILDKLQLIIKWGGEPTHSALYQAQELGENLRNDLSLMNPECLENVDVYSSSERRVTTSAQIFALTFMNVADPKDLPEDFIQVRKDLLDDSNAAKDEMDRVKKKLKHLLREGDAAPPEFAWPVDCPEPFLVVREVVELMKFHHKVLETNYAKLNSQDPSLQHIQAIRWCSGEDAALFRERWEKLFEEFTDAEKVDPSKISELYDSLKFDALHNRQFLEWIFLPDSGLFDADQVSLGSSEAKVSGRKPPSEQGSVKEHHERLLVRDWAQLAQKIGIRRPEADKSNGIRESAESYFNLYGKSGEVVYDKRLSNLRALYRLSKTLFDYIGPQEYGISPDEKLSIGLLTSLPLLREIVEDLEEMQGSDIARSCFYFTKESHIYTLLNCIVEGGIRTKIERKKIPELDYLSHINFELYESENAVADEEDGQERFNYSIRISISPGCHTFNPLDVELDSKHCIGSAPRRSLTSHSNYKEVLETLRAKFHTVKLPKSFIAINISEISPQLFGPIRKSSTASVSTEEPELSLDT